jgi:hypothetical protein
MLMVAGTAGDDAGAAADDPGAEAADTALPFTAVTAALTIRAVVVVVSFPFLARARIMLSLVSIVGETPGFHLTITVFHSGE